MKSLRERIEKLICFDCGELCDSPSLRREQFLTELDKTIAEIKRIPCMFSHEAEMVKDVLKALDSEAKT